MRILNEKNQVHCTFCYGVCGEECLLCCFITVMLIQIKNAVFSYAIQACEAVWDVFLAVPLLVFMVFMCAHVCGWAKWLIWFLKNIARFQCLPPPGPKKTLPTWHNCSVPGSLYQVHRHSITFTSCKRGAQPASEELLTPCFTPLYWAVNNSFQIFDFIRWRKKTQKWDSCK